VLLVTAAKFLLRCSHTKVPYNNKGSCNSYMEKEAMVRDRKEVHEQFLHCLQKMSFLENAKDFSHLILLKGSFQGEKNHIIDLEDGNFLYLGYHLR